jgi:luciferase family oxidoreductase group 1
MTLALSALDLVPLGEGATSGRAVRDSIELAKALERAGYRRVWYAEHHGMPGIVATTPELLIALVAEATSTLRVGAGGVMLPNHATLKVVESFRLLEALHPGRIDLGIGRAPGTDPWTAAALRRSYGPGRGADFLTHLRELLAFDGAGFEPDHPYAAVRVMPDDVRLPPIFLLGSSDTSARLAAELGMGFAFAGHFSSEPPEGPMRDYRDRFRPGSLDRPHAILALAAFAAESDADAERLAASSMRSFIDLRAGRPRRLQAPDVALATPLGPDEEPIARWFRSLAIIGSPSVVRGEIEARAARSGADEVMIATHAFDAGERRRSFDLVAEAFRS